jgi:hypothetical protein
MLTSDELSKLWPASSIFLWISGDFSGFEKVLVGTSGDHDCVDGSIDLLRAGFGVCALYLFPFLMAWLAGWLAA